MYMLISCIIYLPIKIYSLWGQGFFFLSLTNSALYMVYTQQSFIKYMNEWINEFQRPCLFQNMIVFPQIKNLAKLQKKQIQKNVHNKILI